MFHIFLSVEQKFYFRPNFRKLWIRVKFMLPTAQLGNDFSERFGTNELWYTIV